jgi:hypothetical protein
MELYVSGESYSKVVALIKNIHQMGFELTTLTYWIIQVSHNQKQHSHIYKWFTTVISEMWYADIFSRTEGGKDKSL